MMTEMDDPMVLELGLATQAREKQNAVSKRVVGVEASPPALTHSPVDDSMSKHGHGAQSEAAQEEDLALPKKRSKGGGVMERPSESSAFSSPNSGYFNDDGEGTGVAQKKQRNRGVNWAKKETDELLTAILRTEKENTRRKQGTARDVIAKAVPDRTGHECRERMDGLNRSYSKIKEYLDEQGKEFKQLNENDFHRIKVSPRLTEEWYNQIRDNCPPRSKKKLKTNGAGSSSKNNGFVPHTSISGLQPPVVLDRFNQGEPVLVDPPASQLELPVADPIQQQAPASPTSDPASDDIFNNLDDLPDASRLITL